MDEIRCARAEEYREIQHYLEHVYNHTPGYFPGSCPAFWKAETFEPQRTYVICDQDAIASLVRVFPLRMVLGGAEVDVGGIGAVSTRDDKRGRGYMSRLLDHAVREMRREGFPVSVLGGDRHRYRNFGYEHAGRRISLWITARGLKRTGVREVSPRRYLGEPEVLKQVITGYQAHPYHRARSFTEHRLTYERSNMLVFYHGAGQEFGYLILAGEQGRGGVLEFGGHPPTVLAVAARCLARLGQAGLKLFFPDPGLIPGEYLACASDWQVAPAWMLKIVDLDQTLRLFAPQAGKSGSVPPAAETLRSLPEPEQAAALFGTLGCRPFNFFIWPLDMI